MPVDATPVDGASCVTQMPQYPGSVTPRLLAVSCENRNVFTTQSSVESVSGNTILPRIKSVRIPASQQSTLRHIMHTEQGQPINISSCLCIPDAESSSVSLSVPESSSAAECGYIIRFTMQEAMSFEVTCPVVDMTATIGDADAGEVSVVLTPDQTRYPGVYMGQYSLVQLATVEGEDDIVLLSNMFYVIIGRNMSRADGTSQVTGPPTVAEVRLFLRDTSPAESFLLDGVKFADEEIAYSIQLPVMYWNEIPPPLNPIYSTLNFPYRYHWLIAITGHLFMIAAEQNRANNLQYTAGGTAVNDQNKELPYEAAADRRLQEWRSFVMRKKAAINMDLGWGTLGSGYSGYW